MGAGESEGGARTRIAYDPLRLRGRNAYAPIQHGAQGASPKRRVDRLMSVAHIVPASGTRGGDGLRREREKRDGPGNVCSAAPGVLASCKGPKACRARARPACLAKRANPRSGGCSADGAKQAGGLDASGLHQVKSVPQLAPDFEPVPEPGQG